MEHGGWDPAGWLIVTQFTADIWTLLPVSAIETFGPALKVGPVLRMDRLSIPSLSHTPEDAFQVARGTVSGGNCARGVTTWHPLHVAESVLGTPTASIPPVSTNRYALPMPADTLTSAGEVYPYTTVPRRTRQGAVGVHPPPIRNTVLLIRVASSGMLAAGLVPWTLQELDETHPYVFAPAEASVLKNISPVLHVPGRDVPVRNGRTKVACEKSMFLL